MWMIGFDTKSFSINNLGASGFPSNISGHPTLKLNLSISILNNSNELKNYLKLNLHKFKFFPHLEFHQISVDWSHLPSHFGGIESFSR